MTQLSNPALHVSCQIWFISNVKHHFSLECKNAQNPFETTIHTWPPYWHFTDSCCRYKIGKQGPHCQIGIFEMSKVRKTDAIQLTVVWQLSRIVSL